MQQQGFAMTALHFVIPFAQDKKEEKSAVKKTAEVLNADLKIIPLGEDYLKILKNPRYGYGKNLNPCIDCKIFMLKQAKEVMLSMGLEFVVSGEVAGQRPKSQRRWTFALMDKRSGLENRVLRPLSAKILPATLAEDKKIVDRDKLYDIYGRSRRVQIRLAQELGIEEYPQPGGGCLLTDPSFCRRVEDLIEHNELSMDNVQLLKLGRHFRLTPAAKLVVGRDEDENNRLKKLLKKGDLYFETVDLPGPAGLGRGVFSEVEKQQVAGIIARYTSAEEQVKIKITKQ